MSLRPEALAAAALRNFLLMRLPAQVATVNATRAAVVRAPIAGPYTIPASGSLKVSLTDKAGDTTTVALTSGSRTAAQVAAEVNAAVTGIAAADDDGRLVLTSTSAPVIGTPSVMAVGADDTGVNEALGWDVSGEWDVRTALVAPVPKGVCDGMPLMGWFDPAACGQGRVLITIGDRETVPTGANIRRDEYDVTLDVGVFRVEPLQVVQSTREAIQAALQCVRNVLFADTGRSLGAGGDGGVVVTLERSCRVAGRAFQFRGADGQAASPLFDAANLKLLVRVFGRAT